MKKNSGNMQMKSMRGLEHSEEFFLRHGLPMLQEQFPDLLPRLACGLAGHGSECYGFDDDISRDHDFTPGFAIWISADDEERSGFKLSRSYSSLLREHGFQSGKSSALGEMEHGVCRIDAFFLRHIGLAQAPESWEQWLYTPEYAFAEAVNGRVFLDRSGVFFGIRQKIRENMPEDVRLKKLASRAVAMAQNGQYNFSRCLRHGETGAAAIALANFVTNCISLIFLLNHSFAPYYKWMFRALRELPLFGEMAEPLEFLLCDPADAEIKQGIIEDICARIICEFKNRELTSCGDEYLEPHAFEIMKKIRDPRIRALHVMEG